VIEAGHFCMKKTDATRMIAPGKLVVQ